MTRPSRACVIRSCRSSASSTIPKQHPDRMTRGTCSSALWIWWTGSMPEFLADFHLHSRYSRACSKDLTVAELAKWAKIKGIGVLGTGDFTHPLWLQELQETLRDIGTGLYEYEGAQFLLTAEGH